MAALVERLVAARDRIKPLTRYGEDSVWRPANEAHECMADAANAISDLVEGLQGLLDQLSAHGVVLECMARETPLIALLNTDRGHAAVVAARAALAKAGAL